MTIFCFSDIKILLLQTFCEFLVSPPNKKDNYVGNISLEKIEASSEKSVKVRLLASFLHILREIITARVTILQTTYLINLIVRPLLNGKLDQFFSKGNFCVKLSVSFLFEQDPKFFS